MVELVKEFFIDNKEGMIGIGVVVVLLMILFRPTRKIV